MTLAKHWDFGGEDIVLANLKGLVYANPAVRLIPAEKVVFNPHLDTSKKVTLISGGGAGHEPLHAGFVGENLLDAAVSGAMFASPSTKQILAALNAKSDPKMGTLVIAKNYTGDVLHFGLAAERLRAAGHSVEVIFVQDDVAVGRAQNKMVGRRGLAGTALFHKIVGAAAGTGASLKSVAALGRAVNESLVTVGASLDRTSVPGKEEVEFTGHNEAELGLGIHNEPGVKISPIPKIGDLVDTMYEKLLLKTDKDRHYVDFTDDDDYVLLVNNIGGTSSLELHAILQHVFEKLPLKKRPQRVLVGEFVTSLNAPGFSITLLNLTKASGLVGGTSEVGGTVDGLLQFLDAPTNAPGWRAKSFSHDHWAQAGASQLVDAPTDANVAVSSDLRVDAAVFEKGLRGGLEKLLKAEPTITHYDTVVGDGDCGETLALGANAILNALKNDKTFYSSLSDPVATVNTITDLVEDNMGGTSGGIYLIYLTALVQHLQKAKEALVETFAVALHGALHEGLFKYTKARVGGRTLVDTLQPFVDTLKDTGDIKKAVSEAKKACDATKQLHAQFGRASYVNDEEFKAEGGIPDPGAVGLLAIIEGFVEAL